EFVDGIGGYFNGGLIAEREVCRRQIIVDGLGNTNDVESLFKESLRDTLRSVAANVDDGLNTLVLQAANKLVRPVFTAPRPVGSFHGPVKRPSSIRGANDGSTANVNAGDGRQIQNLQLHRLG